MPDYRDGVHAQKILSMQKTDGSFGPFHSMSSGAVITTEQALTRLERLGFTENDPCIQRATAHLHTILESKTFPEGNEKKPDFSIFAELVAAACIRRFTWKDPKANAVAKTWAGIITAAFGEGDFSVDAYRAAFEKSFGQKPKSGRLCDFVNFYPLSLLPGTLEMQTERKMLTYVLKHESGIYYIYESRLDILPQHWKSKQASRYLGAIELLCRYPTGREHCKFALDWIKAHQREDGSFDMGAAAKDGVYFPLSDRWDQQGRVKDCTHRIRRLLGETGEE